MLFLYRYTLGVNIREEGELFRLKNNNNEKSSAYRRPMDKFRLEIRKRFIIIMGVKF